jgi:uncharacterized protein (DUF1810 family)
MLGCIRQGTNGQPRGHAPTRRFCFYAELSTAKLHVSSSADYTEMLMPPTSDTTGNPDPFDLQRFVSAQEKVYANVLAELRSGQKRTHWMWYIFPQMAGLGYSSTAKHYAIQRSEEARQYLNHPVLGKRLIECTEAVLAVQGRSASAIFGSPDDVKLKSSMTLFAALTPPGSLFAQVLDRYFQGQRDSKTLDLLEQHSAK